MKHWILGCTLIFIMGVLVSACTKKQGDPAPTNEIVIGEISSLTGSEATFGISTRNGVDMVIEAANKAGGIDGKKLRIVVLDDQGKPEEAAAAITRLITQDKVIAVIGEVASSRSLAMAPIAQSNKIPMISPASTNPKVTQIGDYIFRVCYIDPFQGPIVARFAFDSLNSKRSAILKDLKSDYSIGLAQFYKEKFVSMGGQIVSEQTYSGGDIDFKAQLTAIRATKPDFIFAPGYYTDVGLIVRQARELGITVPMGGGDGWDSEKLFEIGGKALNGTYFANHYSADSKEPVLRKFVTDYKAKYGAVPDSLAALGYDAAGILIEALKRAKSLNGPDLRDAIAATKDFVGVTGKITIDGERNAVKSAVILKIQDLKQSYVQTVQP